MQCLSWYKSLSFSPTLRWSNTPPTHGIALIMGQNNKWPRSQIHPPLRPDHITRIQKIIGTLLYYGHAVNSIILPCLGYLGTAHSKPTEHTDKLINQLLNYLHTNPDATVRYHASGMVLHIHSDTSYLSDSNARSRAGGYFLLGDTYPDIDLPPSLDTPLPPPNGAIYVLSCY